MYFRPTWEKSQISCIMMSIIFWGSSTLFFFLEERNGSVSIISHCEATTGQWQDNSSFEWSQKVLGREKGEKEREMPTLGSRLIGHIMSQMKRVAGWDGPYACRKSSCITEWQKIPEARHFFFYNSFYHCSLFENSIQLYFSFSSSNSQ